MTRLGSPIEVQHVGGAEVVAFRDHLLLDAGVIEQIEEHFKSLTCRYPEGRLVIDFTNVQALSSRMLGVLVTAHNELRKKDGKIALANLHGTLQKMLRVTRLSDLFSIYPDQKSAIEGICSAMPAE